MWKAKKDIDFLLHQFSHLFYFVKIKDNSAYLVDYAAFAKDKSLKGEFIRTVMGRADLPEEDKATVIHYGLQALGSRGDPGRMKLIKCHIENFGKLSDFTYDLQMAATPSVRKTAGEKAHWLHSYALCCLDSGMKGREIRWKMRGSRGAQSLAKGRLRRRTAI